MKLHKVVSINGKPYELVGDETRLDLRTPGRAVYTVKSPIPLRGMVTLDLGYNSSALQRYFLGYIERSTSTNSREQILLCREMSAILTQRLPLGLRHVDLGAVLVEVSRQTGLRFRVPAAAYAKIRTPYFYSLGAGIQAFDSLAQVFGIPDLIWQQQGNGEVYVGSWADSYWGARGILELPTELFDGYQGNRSATLPALPALRPGVSINQGQRVTSVTLTDTHMAIQWTRP